MSFGGIETVARRLKKGLGFEELYTRCEPAIADRDKPIIQQLRLGGDEVIKEQRVGGDVALVDSILYLAEGEHLGCVLDKKSEGEAVEELGIVLSLDALDDAHHAIGAAAADSRGLLVGQDDDELSEEQFGPTLYGCAVGSPLEVELLELFVDFTLLVFRETTAALVDPDAGIVVKVLWDLGF